MYSQSSFDCLTTHSAIAFEITKKPLSVSVLPYPSLYLFLRHTETQTHITHDASVALHSFREAV